MIDDGVIIPFTTLDVIKERPEILVALLKRVANEQSNLVSVTYDELARECGYANRSGAWKNVQKLISNGLMQQIGRGQLLINLKMVM